MMDLQAVTQDGLETVEKLINQVQNGCTGLEWPQGFEVKAFYTDKEVEDITKHVAKEYEEKKALDKLRAGEAEPMEVEDNMNMVGNRKRDEDAEEERDEDAEEERDQEGSAMKRRKVDSDIEGKSDHEDVDGNSN
jgi:hypothetical protein